MRVADSLAAGSSTGLDLQALEVHCVSAKFTVFPLEHVGFLRSSLCFLLEHVGMPVAPKRYRAAAQRRLRAIESKSRRSMSTGGHPAADLGIKRIQVSRQR